MKIFGKLNVWDAALERIRFLYDEFGENVVVCTSGGKDSVVVTELCIKVAREKGLLPINLLFIDQEAEWQAVIDYIEATMDREEVNPLWLQCHIKIFNAVSHKENWVHAWRPEDEHRWMREKSSISIHENTFGTLRFKPMFAAFLNHWRPEEKACMIGGVRAEESPARTVSLTYRTKYKHITWAKRHDNKKAEHFTFYPLYDWSYTDIWKAIHSNGWRYCRIYDYMFRYGYGVNDMRVSNLHHETSFKQLFFMQEIEPQTWEKMAGRADGINTAKHLKKGMMAPKTLPPMFESWREYRDYLLEKMVTDPDIKAKFLREFKHLDSKYIHPMIADRKDGECVSSILANDYFLTKIGNFKARPEVVTYRRWLAGKLSTRDIPKGGLAFIEDAINNPVPGDGRLKREAAKDE